MKANITFSRSITLFMLLSLCLSTITLADNSNLPEDKCDELSPAFFFAGTGDSCVIPIVISEGLHTVDTLVGEGAVGDTATAAKWYSYTPAMTGIVNINSCLGGSDTRLWVWTGDCSAPVLVANNDDNCDLGDGNANASEVNFMGNAGTEYLINWDDRWSASGFDFTVTIGEIPLVDVTVTVDMSQETVAPDGAHIAGSFNGWTGEPMMDNGNGTWSFTITGITAGDMVEYKFQNGFESWEDEMPIDCTVAPPPYNNRFFIAGFENSTEPTVCFNSCEACPPLGTCANPYILIEDDLEGLALGDATGQVAHWGARPGGAVGGTVIADPTFNSGQVIRIDGSSGTQDALFVLNDTTAGHFVAFFELYIPYGNKAYFNLQHEAPTDSEGFWAFDVYFNDGGTGTIELNDADGSVIDFEYYHDNWFSVAIFADIDNDEARIVIDRTTIAAWNFSDGVTNGGAPYPSSGLNSVNFYTPDASYVYLIDNVALVELPAAGTNEYCYTATDISPGITSVGELQCFGAMWDTGFGNGYSGAWYRYQPDEDGVITLSSCNGGIDTRVWIFEGDCHDLKIVGINDDQCDQGSGQIWASYREAIVTGGKTYYILWDNIRSPLGFDFELTFSTDAPEPGHFCQSAIPVTPGELNLLETFDGNAAVAGPLNGVWPSAYAKSNWYQYTPPVDTTITITSCEGATDVTWVFVYTGDCSNFDGLELISEDVASCGTGAALIENLQVTAGTTYYIEWINVSDLPFNWMIEYYIMGPEVTFHVDMSEETVATEGVYIVGEMNGWTSQPMIDNGDSTWSISLQLRANDTITYRFQNGFGGWESGIPAECTLDGFGDRFVVTGGNMVIDLDLVCFNACTECGVINVEELAFQNSIEVYPNPAKDLTNIIYDFDQAADLIVRLSNNLGQIVSTDLLVNAQSGNHKLELNKLATGIYYLNITNGKHSKVTKLLIE